MKPRTFASKPITGKEPWRQFDSDADWYSLLSSDGWTNHGDAWTRPGKVSGTSAMLREAKSGDFVLVVFSANAPVEPGTYSASSYLALARYSGDFTRANQAIKEGIR